MYVTYKHKDSLGGNFPLASPHPPLYLASTSFDINLDF